MSTADTLKLNGLNKWACSECGWKSITPSKNRILLHIISECVYKPMGRRSCLTPYIKLIKTSKQKPFTITPNHLHNYK